MTFASLNRRAMLSGALALAACDVGAQPETGGPPPALKALAPFPVGAAVYGSVLEEPAYVDLLTRHFDQVTPDWEMKMEIVLRPDGSLDFSRPDRIVNFARDRGLRVFGHTLAWFDQEPAFFAGLLDDRIAFAREYRRYITAVVGHFRGRVVGWDVVNEPVTWEGDALHGGYWSQALGLDYIDRAFHHAHEADPGALLFLNEYDLEHKPQKRRTYLRLAETLLKRGVPLGGLGTQSHLRLDSDPAAIRTSLRDLASLGLPIHVSEVDVRSTGRGDELERQARVVAALAEAYAEVPARQRFAFTFWGVRDQDSWLWRESPEQRPLLFDPAGRPKPAFRAAADAWRGR